MSTAQPLGQMIIELGLDESHFTSGMKGVNQQIKTSMAEMKAHLNIMGRSGNEVDILKAKQTGLSGVLDAQNKKVELAKEKYEACKAAVEGNSEATQEQKDALIKAQNEYVKAVGELGSYERQLKEVDIKLTAMESSTYKVGSALESFGTKLTTVGNKITAVGTGLTVGLTTPIVALGTYAIKTAAEFDEAMSKVAAVSGATGGDFDALRSKAREMGESTKFSATEAAEAMNYMAMAGWKTNEMLDGIEGIMHLAAASGEDLARTSDIVTDALTAFGMTAADSGHFADILAAASSNANTNVSMMGETFKYCAPIAGALGFSAEDTAEAIGLMANAGIKSSQAGTALRTIMNSLSSEIVISGYKLGDYAVEVADADGNMRDLSDILADCRVGFSQLSESEQAAAAEAIAGKNAMSGFLAIMNAAPADIDKLTNAIAECDGTAESMAETMQDNLKGQLTILKSQTDELAISFGDILMPKARSLVSGVQDLVDWFNKMDDSTKETIVNVGLFAAAIGPVVLVVGKLTSGIGSLVTNIGKSMQSFALWAAKITHTTTVTAAHTVATGADTAATEVHAAITAKETAGLMAKTVKLAADTVATNAHAVAQKAVNLVIAAGDGTLKAHVASLNASVAAKIKDTAATTAYTVAEKAKNVVLGLSHTHTTLYTAALAAKTVALNLCAAAGGVLTAAFKLLLGPIGLITAAAAALVVGVTALVKWFTRESEASKQLTADTEALAEANESLIGSLESSESAYQDNVASIKEEAGAASALAAKINELSLIENKSAAQKMELASYVDTLNNSVEGLNLQYNEQTDSLNMTTDAIYEQIDAFEKQADMQAAQERLTEILRERIAVNKQLSEVQEKIIEVTEDASLKEKERKKILAELEEQELSLQNQLGDLGECYSDVTDVIISSSQAQAEAIAAQAEAQKRAAEEQLRAIEASAPTIIQAYDSLADAYEDMGERQKKALDGILSAYETMTGSLSKLTSQIELDWETSWWNIQQNQADTIQKTREFSNLYAQLIEAGVSESYLRAIGATGPESIPLLKDMLRQGTDTVLKSQSEWQDAYGIIGDTLVDSLGLDATAKGAIRDYVLGESGIYGTLKGAVEAADLNAIGKSVTEGLRNGILESVENANSATKELVEGLTDEARDALGINSPSRVFKEIGKFTIEGLVSGINGERNALENAIRTAMDSAARIATNTMETALRQLTSTTASAFNRMPVDARNGMNGVNGAITSGMSSVTREITSGMNSANNTIASGMNGVTNAISSGMNGANSSIASGMNGINSAISSGMNTSKNTVSMAMKNIEASFKSSMQGINSQYNYDLAVINNTVSSKMNTISNTMTNSQNRIKSNTSNWLSGLQSVYTSGINSIVNLSINGSNRIVNAFDIYNSMRIQGQNAGIGFYNGLSSKESSIYSKARSIANNVSWTISNALDIHSPSRVLKKLGEYTMEGFGLGIEGMQGYISGIVEDTAGIVSDGFTDNHLSMPVLTVDTDAIQKINRTLEVTAEEQGRENTSDKMDRILTLLESFVPLMLERTKMDKLYDILEEYLPSMTNMQVVLDDGTLVGAIAPEVDAYMGMKKERRDRDYGRSKIR